MDMAALSMNLSQIQAYQSASISVMKMAIDTSCDRGTGVLSGCDSLTGLMSHY